MAHQPVLLKEVLEIFNPQPGEKYIDATINGGGHAMAILDKIGPEGELLGIDRDRDLILSLENQSQKFKNLKLVCDNYANIKHIASKYGFDKVSGIIFDIGFSSYHIEKSGRGFSFLKDEPLDMRYGASGGGATAAEIINKLPEPEIGKILRDYGEEKFSGKIAAEIARSRKNKKITRTSELVAIIRKAVPAWYLRRKIHFATKVFQAFRIAVNKELENLEKALADSADILAPSGKLVVISFHSLEDRVVKNFLKEKSRENILEIITPKPLTPSPEEQRRNPRSRSAKLRAAKKI